MWVVLFNPSSGGGKGRRIATQVKDYLASQNLEIHEVSGPDYESARINFKKVLDQHSERIKAVVVVGGDGMVHLAIQELANSAVPMALIPAGTGNDFARALKLDLKNPISNLKHYLDTSPVAVDLGKVKGRFFADILSTGFDSIVNERANRMRLLKGRMKYNIAIILVLSTFRPKSYRFRVDAIDFTTEAMLIAVSNGQSYGGGMKVTPGARIDDGLFDVMILGPVSKFEFLRVFPKVFSGSHTSHPAVKIMRGSSVTIESEAIAYADGERMGELPVTAEIAPSALLTWRNL